MTTSPTISIDTYIPYMRDVGRCEQSLRELGLMWRMVESTTKATCRDEARAILPTISATREGFHHLEKELVVNLVQQKVANVLMEIGTKAHYIIDIVVRNLYERTADIGFLATDRELCAFAAGMTYDAGQVVQRLKAYRSKYTVYDQIVMLDLEGRTIAQAEGECTACEVDADLVAHTLESSTYVETFRHSPLQPDKLQALIYSRTLHHPDNGKPVGILCLCFNFEEEMAGIFRSYRDPAARFNMLLIDGDNRVIASADEHWVPLGTVMQTAGADDSGTVLFGGREYLTRTFSAAGYQGYMGPPAWKGQVMVPVDVAFSANTGSGETDTDLSRGLLAHAATFCPPLHDIMQAADTIRRVVWNGQVMASTHEGDPARLRTVLEQINETGAHSQSVFTRSIDELHRTAVTAGMNEVMFTSHLLVDLLDRNLYERSADCRWWALTPELRNALAAGDIDAASLGHMSGILDYINGLYTVYTRIFVYDARGSILVSTDLEGTGKSIAGMRVEEQVLEKVLKLASEQEYCVSDFAASPFYDGQPTYVYHAAIRDPQQPSRVVGGIGIVFNSEKEFSGMLASALEGKPDMDAYLVDRSGKVISTTDPAHPVGSIFESMEMASALRNGQRNAAVTIHDGQYAVAGSAMSCGYREFKVDDGYRDDVIAVVTRKLGAVGKRSKHDGVLDGAVVVAGNDWGREFATFVSDGHLFAIPTDTVLGAVAGSCVNRLSMGGKPERIGVVTTDTARRKGDYVWVYDFGMLTGAGPTHTMSGGQVVLLRCGKDAIGLLVDDVHAVCRFAEEGISAAPVLGQGAASLVKELIQANAGDVLIQLVDVNTLFEQLRLDIPPAVAMTADVRILPKKAQNGSVAFEMAQEMGHEKVA